MTTTETGKALVLAIGARYTARVSAIEAEAIAQANAEADAIFDDPGVNATILAYFDERRNADRVEAVAAERARIRAAVEGVPECPCGHGDDEHVHYCFHEERTGSCSCDAEYVDRAAVLAIIDGREP